MFETALSQPDSSGSNGPRSQIKILAQGFLAFGG